jgi:hypothetical protein
VPVLFLCQQLFLVAFSASELHEKRYTLQWHTKERELVTSSINRLCWPATHEYVLALCRPDLTHFCRSFAPSTTGLGHDGDVPATHKPDNQRARYHSCQPAESQTLSSIAPMCFGRYSNLHQGGYFCWVACCCEVNCVCAGRHCSAGTLQTT